MVLLSGYGYPVLAASRFLDEAKSHGAEVHYSAGVQQLEAGESTTGRHPNEVSD